MLRIGSLTLDLPVVQAALSGYSDLPMRRVARLFGVSYTLNEVVLDRLVIQKGRKRRATTTVHPDDHPVGGQLMGAEPVAFAQAADALVQAGYDIVDINFGCPVKKVLGRCRGGYLLSDPPTALAIIRAVVEAVDRRRPVTLKMRRGMDDSAESEHKFFTILDGAFAAGIDAVTVHPRTVRQRYVGSSHWPFLKRVKQHVGDRVVLGSGDLFSAEDCIRMIDETGVDGVALARGCIGNPWIFRECREILAGRPVPAAPSVAEQGEVISQHFEWTVEAYGEKVAGKVMRKFGIKYSELHPMGREVRDAFITAKTAADFRAVLQRWYDPARDWPPGVRRIGPGHLVAAGARVDC